MKAADEIDRLREFIDAVDDTSRAMTQSNHSDSRKPRENNERAGIRSGNQERLYAGLGDDREEEHDGSEPGAEHRVRRKTGRAGHRQ